MSGAIKSRSDYWQATGTQQLTDKARRRKHPGTFVPALTAFFAGLRFKPTATSHGFTRRVGALDRGRLSTRDTNEHYGGQYVGGQ